MCAKAKKRCIWVSPTVKKIQKLTEKNVFIQKDDLRHLRSLINQNADADFSLGFYIKCWIFAAPFRQDPSQFLFSTEEKK